MFPLRDHNPSTRTPFVTNGLVVINVLIFLAYWTSIQSEMGLQTFFETWGLVPARVTNGEGVAGVLTSMFLHGGWMHLLGNMLFLWIFGDNLEDVLGHAGFLAFYLITGALAGGAQIMIDPTSPIPMVGASGAIAGVMGGYLVLFPKAKVDVLFIFLIFFRIFAIPAWIVLGVWIGLQFFSGFASPTEEGGVAYWAHIGGFLAGLILIVPAFMARGAQGYWARTQGHPPHPEAHYPIGRSNVPKVTRRPR